VASLKSRPRGFDEGVMFVTYSLLAAGGGSGGKKGKGAGRKKETRLDELVKWCGGAAFDGCLIFDECHKAKGIDPSKMDSKTKTTATARAVVAVQERMPKARVVYVSATGASDIKQMAYMTRLGLWGPGTAFPSPKAFCDTLGKTGVGGMELVAMDLKARGLFLARSLSFRGADFKVEETPENAAFTDTYNKAVDLWTDMWEHLPLHIKTLNERYMLSDKETKALKEGPAKSAYWGAHQRFFLQVCTAAALKTI
jgi:hypothetical protein